MSGTEYTGATISGGNVTITALSVGPQARASAQVEVPAAGYLAGEPGDSLPALLEELLEALRQHADDIQGPAAQDAARQLLAELEQGRRPDRARLNRLLTALAAAAGPVAGIAAAVTSVLRAAGIGP